MGEVERDCVGCEAVHLAGLWYQRDSQRDMESSQEWLCGVKYNELPNSEKARWRLGDLHLSS